MIFPGTTSAVCWRVILTALILIASVSTGHAQAVWQDSTFLPLGEVRQITSDFGYRRDPFFGGRASDFHYGMDFKADVGDSVYAWQKGQVIFAGYTETSGNMIHLQHQAGMVSKYHHLKKIFVKNGDLVKGGELIGLSGKSGRVTGPHLHFSLLQVGEHLNPLPYLDDAYPVVKRPRQQAPPIQVIKHVLVKSYPASGLLVLDGEEIGPTPQELGLTYGEHFVEIVPPAGYQRFVARLYVDNLFASIYTAKLSPQAAGPAPENHPASIDSAASQ